MSINIINEHGERPTVTGQASCSLTDSHCHSSSHAAVRTRAVTLVEKQCAINGAFANVDVEIKCLMCVSQSLSQWSARSRPIQGCAVHRDDQETFRAYYHRRHHPTCNEASSTFNGVVARTAARDCHYRRAGTVQRGCSRLPQQHTGCTESSFIHSSQCYIDCVHNQCSWLSSTRAPLQAALEQLTLLQHTDDKLQTQAEDNKATRA